MLGVRSTYEILLEELWLAPQGWLDVLSSIKFNTNASPLRILGRRKDEKLRAPLQVMTGLHPIVQTLKCDKKSRGETLSINTDRTLQLIETSKLQLNLDSIHKKVHESVTKKCLKELEWHNAKTNVVSPQFELDDFVLVSKPEKSWHKLAFQ